mmetsp:Transcript_3865/g.2587  ORF Transcript_3865/g.2587 Transcript_3865/m.2587 type:complete len:116 (+) Transcript_3865:25-372(+)
MGSCTSRDSSPSVYNAPAVENYAFKAESRVMMQACDYDTYQSAIKRFGYRIDLNEEHLKSISKEIKFDTKAIDDEKLPHSIVYMDPQFAKKEGRHNVTNLNKIAWIMCKHYDETT